MNNANFEFTMKNENPWTQLSTGAKCASIIAAIGIGAASIAASIFLAGAALFSLGVFTIYQWLSGKSKNANSQEAVIDGEAEQPESATQA